eukprot:m.74957 g.74957  ORF g.74957 m.74957 type:complete len:319 (-) comp14549_c0_seq2:160-1116(-)
MSEFVTDVSRFSRPDDDPMPSYAWALYDYQRQHPDELDLVAGEAITVLRKGSDGWNRVVKYGGHVGFVPANYLQDAVSEQPSPAPAAAPAESNLRPRTSTLGKTPRAPKAAAQTIKFSVRAVYSFSSMGEGQLTFSEGEVFQVTDDSDADWYHCISMRSGESGVVPRTYTEVLPDVSSQAHKQENIYEEVSLNAVDKNKAAAAEAAARQEAARQEAARQEAARQEAARQEAARQEAARQEAARQDAARASLANAVEDARARLQQMEAERDELQRTLQAFQQDNAAREQAAKNAQKNPQKQMLRDKINQIRTLVADSAC